MTVVNIGNKDIEYVYGQMKNASRMDEPAERLLGAIILRFCQNGLASWLDVDWVKLIRTIGGIK